MKQKTLSNLEQEVMDIVWKYKQRSAREVLMEIEKDKKLAYTTVATILQRLYKKGFVKRTEDKIGYLYSPRLTKELYGRNVARSFLKRFIDYFGDGAIASFAQSIDKLPPKKRDYFLKLIEKYDKNK